MAGGIQASRSTRVARSARTGHRARPAHAYREAVPEQLADLQRARIVGAMFDVATRRGAGSVTVGHVVERSGVSRRTFYENFDDLEGCLLAAFERAVTLAFERVVPAYEARKSWREQIRAGLVALLDFCDQEPSVAWMLVCASQVSGARVMQRRTELLAHLTRIVDQGRQEGKATHLSSLAADGTIGGVLAVIQAKLTEPKHEPLILLTNELMSIIVLPYLGSTVARRELERPLPVSASVPRGDALISDPFKDAGMRLTYRTVRVLMAIAENPLASNRQIGESSGMADPGQISKLLARLERIGLIVNTGMYPGRGAPNSWTLTDKGRRIAENIRVNTEGSSK